MIALQTVILICGLILLAAVIGISYRKSRASDKKPQLERQEDLREILHESPDEPDEDSENTPSSLARMEPQLTRVADLEESFHEGENHPQLFRPVVDEQPEEHDPEEPPQPGDDPARQSQDDATEAELLASLAEPKQGEDNEQSVEDIEIPDSFSSQIDFIARIPGSDLVIRDQVLSVYRENEYLLEKPHRIYGLWDTDGEWKDLENEPENGRYRDLLLKIQLADRKGSITESELTRFSMLVLRLAESLGRRFKFSESFEDAQIKARQLDQFCKEFDVLAILNIVSMNNAEFIGTDIDQYARELDLNLGPMNIYHRSNEDGNGQKRIEFSLANLYKPGSFDPDHLNRVRTQGLTMFMNMPSTNNPEAVFEAMISTAQQLCQRLNARLVDQNQQPLSARGLKNIQVQIRKIAADMQSQGVAPGSETARRLF